MGYLVWCLDFDINMDLACARLDWLRTVMYGTSVQNRQWTMIDGLERTGTESGLSSFPAFRGICCKPLRGIIYHCGFVSWIETLIGSRNC